MNLKEILKLVYDLLKKYFIGDRTVVIDEEEVEITSPKPIQANDSEEMEDISVVIPVEELELLEEVKVLYYNKITRCDSPSGKWDVSLSNRLKAAKKAGSELHISIHANAYGKTWNTATGTEAYYSTDRSKELANDVQVNMIKGCKNRGVKKADFYITREFPEAGIESVLFEGPFMTCKIDLNKLKSDAFRKGIAQLYAIKIYDYCLKYNITNISIDAGHGLPTEGKRSFDGSLQEWTYNQAVVEYIIEILKQK